MIDVKDLVVEKPNKRVIIHPGGTREEVEIERGFTVPPGTTPWNHETAQLLQGDIRGATVRAGESIKAGEVVNVQNGQAYRDIVAVANVENQIFSSRTGATAACKLSDRYSVAVFSASDVVSASIFLIDNITGKAVTSKSLFSNGTGAASMSVVRLSDTQCMFQYKGSGISATIVTVNGTAMTAGSWSAVASSAANYEKLLPLDNSHALSVYDLSGLKCKVLSASGSTIDVSGTVYSLNGNSAAYISAARLPDAANGNKRVCICYQDIGDGYKGKAVVATITAASVVTFGTPVVFCASSTQMISCCVDGEDILISYITSSTAKVSLLVAAVDGWKLQSTCDLDTTVTVNGFSTQVIKCLDNFVVHYDYRPTGNDFHAKAAIVQRDGNLLTKRDSYEHQKHYFRSITAISNDRMLICYSAAANSQYGYTTILTANGSRIAGSFADESRDAIALDNGEGGQAIRVAYSGMVQLAGAKVGDRIDSDGVRAYSPQDSWLDVTAWWNRPYIAGVYIGDGTKRRTIDLGFMPKAVIITDTRRTYLSGTSDRSSGGIALINCPVEGYSSDYDNIIEIHANGFVVSHDGSHTIVYANEVNCKYAYIAFC